MAEDCSDMRARLQSLVRFCLTMASERSPAQPRRKAAPLKESKFRPSSSLHEFISPLSSLRPEAYRRPKREEARGKGNLRPNKTHFSAPLPHS